MSVEYEKECFIRDLLKEGWDINSARAEWDKYNPPAQEAQKPNE